MAVRGMMIMRATIQRDLRTEGDNYNQPGPPAWTTIETEIACRVWKGGTGGRRTDAGAERTITTDMPMAVFPLDTDITEKDRLLKIEDRQGRELFGMMYVDAVLRRKDHLAVGLRNHD